MEILSKIRKYPKINQKFMIGPPKKDVKSNFQQNKKCHKIQIILVHLFSFYPLVFSFFLSAKFHIIFFFKN